VSSAAAAAGVDCSCGGVEGVQTDDACGGGVTTSARSTGTRATSIEEPGESGEPEAKARPKARSNSIGRRRKPKPPAGYVDDTGSRDDSDGDGDDNDA
jgi:hypothetical protein